MVVKELIQGVSFEHLITNAFLGHDSGLNVSALPVLFAMVDANTLTTLRMGGKPCLAMYIPNAEQVPPPLLDIELFRSKISPVLNKSFHSII